MFSSKFRSSYTIWLAAIHIPANSSKTLSATQVIKPPLATARAAACNRTVHLFVCPFVCLSNYLSPNAKNAIFSKLSNLDAYWRPIGSHAWAFQKPIIVPLKFKMAEIRHLENRHYVIFSADGGQIWIKFRRLVQNDMSTAVIWSKSEPEVEFQYGGRLFEFNACHPRATCHVAGCCHWVNSLSLFQSHMPHCRV